MAAMGIVGKSHRHSSVDIGPTSVVCLPVGWCGTHLPQAGHEIERRNRDSTSVGPWKPGLAPFLLVKLVIQHLSDQEERSVGD